MKQQIADIGMHERAFDGRYRRPEPCTRALTGGDRHRFPGTLDRLASHGCQRLAVICRVQVTLVLRLAPWEPALCARPRSPSRDMGRGQTDNSKAASSSGDATRSPAGTSSHSRCCQESRRRGVRSRRATRPRAAQRASIGRWRLLGLAVPNRQWAGLTGRWYPRCST